MSLTRARTPAPGARPGHVAVARALGLRPMSITTALGVSFYEEYHPYGTSAYPAFTTHFRAAAARYRARVRLPGGRDAQSVVMS